MLRLTSVGGLLGIIALAWLMSSHKRRFSPRIVLGGLCLQFGFALLILHTAWGRGTFQFIGDRISQLLQITESSGGIFLFEFFDHAGVDDKAALVKTFAFGVLPTIVFFSSLMSVFYYLGVMQLVISALAKIMQKTLGVSGAESLAAAANVFVGHTEAPLVIRPYVAGMTCSELNATMVGGFATITGSLLAVFGSMGIDVGHLLTASVISAPAALLIAKVMQPETEESQTLGSVKIQVEQRAVNLVDAAAVGAGDGMKLALNVGAMLIAFLALIALADALIGWAGTVWVWSGIRLGIYDAPFDPGWSLSAILGYLFAPLAWLMGIEAADCRAAGQLLGTKMVVNEFVAYKQMGDWNAADSPVQLTERSRVILTYALSGFSNFGAIGIQIGGIGGIAPERRSDLARLGLRAMLGGTLACCMTACIAGILL